MKKFLIFFLCFICVSMPAFAVKGVKFIAKAQCDFKPNEQISEYLSFTTTSKIIFDDNLKIPEGSVITIKYRKSVHEKRFHKSGFFTGNLVKYTSNGQDIPINDRSMETIVRRYDKIDAKEAAKTGAELTTTTVAAFMIPGIDIAYYFVKGAIQNEKADTRFKSGVHNAYDNSILWVFLKGKPIVFSKDEYVSILLFKNDGSVKDDDMAKYCE